MSSSDAIVGGTKISLRSLAQRLEALGYSFKHVWEQVEEIVVKSLIAC